MHFIDFLKNSLHGISQIGRVHLNRFVSQNSFLFEFPKISNIGRCHMTMSRLQNRFFEKAIPTYEIFYMALPESHQIFFLCELSQVSLIDLPLAENLLKNFVSAIRFI